MPLKMRVKLSAMMFLQFMMLPVWFVPMFPYVQKLPGGGQWAFWCGMIMGFGTLASPLFGMFADRFLNAEKVLALSNFVCAALLGCCYFVKDPALLFFLLLAVMIVYMPSWSLTATIAMANSTTAAFPQIRVFGSLGWVASAVFSTAWPLVVSFTVTVKDTAILASAASCASGQVTTPSTSWPSFSALLKVVPVGTRSVTVTLASAPVVLVYWIV